jgi:hypothetical protein
MHCFIRSHVHSIVFFFIICNPEISKSPRATVISLDNDMKSDGSIPPQRNGQLQDGDSIVS